VHYDKPERCPEDSGAFKEIHYARFDKVLRQCTTCTVHQWCDAKGNALGTPANIFLRRSRILAHDVFDQLWRGGFMKRHEAYKWLAEAMGRKSVHMAGLTTLECHEVVRLAEAELARRRGPA
jgi:hypothetical protein